MSRKARAADLHVLWPRWLFPDLALLVSLAALFYCLTIYDGCRKLFRDSDAGWHIHTGEAILAGAGLPRSDPYSFSRPGEPWYAWEWASDAALGAAHRAGGLRGVALLAALAIAAGVWMWFRLHWAVGGNFLLACLMASPMLSTTNLHWLARPHVLGWLFLLGAVWYAESVSRAEPSPPLARHSAGVALFAAAWANFHASFFLAPAIGLIYAVSHFARPLIWDLDAGQERRKARWFLGAALVAALASLLNPYGWRLHAHLSEYLTNRELLARVAEFQSFNFHVEGAFQILAGLGLAALGGLLALGQKRLAHFLLAVALLAGALRSARGLPVAALVLLPLANGAITQALREARGLRRAVRRRLDAFLDYSDRLRALETRLNGFALVPLAALAAGLWLGAPAVAARTGFPPEEFPVAAAAALEKLPESTRLLAPDKYGGYLIYRFQGRRKVFFDGRSDFYGSDFMKRYVRLIEVRPEWRKILESFEFSHALLPCDYSLGAALETEGWRRLYADRTAVLLERERR